MATSLREGGATVAASGSGKAVLVLDASESAETAQSQITNLAAAVLGGLPATIQRQLFFLGNPEPYPQADLQRFAVRWFEENRRRVSIVAPVFEALGDDIASVVIIGCGRIYDLEDWEGTPILDRTLLVRVGDSLQAPPGRLEELASPAPEEILSRLCDPVARVEISGSGFMPIFWDNRGYRLEVASGRATLGAARLETYRVRVAFLILDGERLTVRSRRESGREVLEQFPPTGAELPPATAGELGPEERAVFRDASQGRSFRCPRCRKEHPADTLRCIEGSVILGESVYPTLERAKAAGFVLFEPRAERVTFRVHPCDVLRLGEATVALREGSRALIYRFDPVQTVWVNTHETLRPYQLVGGNEYAILL